MKRILSLLLALCLTFSICACGQEAVSSTPAPAATVEPTPEPTPEPTSEPTPESFDAAAAAEKIAGLMGGGDFEAVMARANETLKGMVDADYLYSMWDSLVSGLGDFESVNTVMTTTGEYQGYSEAAAFCEFSAGGLGVICLFDQDGKLDSMLFNYYTPLDQYDFADSSDSTPLLWRVTSPDGGELYLFGSYHMGQPEFYPLPETVMEAYESSDALAVEYDMLSATFDLNSLMEMQSAVLYTDGTTVADHLSEKTYQMAVDLMAEKGAYNTSLDSYHVSQWSSLILQLACGELGFDSTYGVDHYLLTLAHHQGKKVLEVESQAEQLALLTSTSDLYNDASIRASVEDYEEGKEALLELYEAYRTGNEEELSRLLLEDGEVDSGELNGYTADELDAILAEAGEYSCMMYDERNFGMAEKAEEYLASGETVFFVVGAAHMVGDTGLVRLLTDAGCAVEKVEY